MQDCKTYLLITFHIVICTPLDLFYSFSYFLDEELTHWII